MKRLFLALGFVFSRPLAGASLPIIEVPAARSNSDTLVVFISGDGGWAKIDKAIARVLSRNGIPVAGLNSLQYFWTKRTPESAAADLETIIATYTAKWNKRRVVLAGYSRGADVLPAMAARLSQETKGRIRAIALFAPSLNAQFEFHVTDWFRDTSAGMPVRPELEKLRGMRLLCVAGEEERESLCRGLAGEAVRVVTLRGSHHFDGQYEKLAQLLIEELQ